MSYVRYVCVCFVSLLGNFSFSFSRHSGDVSCWEGFRGEGESGEGGSGKGKGGRGGVYHLFFYSCTADPVVRFPDGGVTRVTEGNSLTITCSTSGSDPPVTFINITSGGQLLSSVSDPIQGRLDFTIIATSLADHGTVYMCTAVNTIGSTSESFTLSVQGM